MSQLPVLVAFLAGIVSFLSPCILPIVPAYLAYLAGETSAQGGRATRGQIFLTALCFVLGFSMLFALIGVLVNGALAHSGMMLQTWLARAGGLVVIFFGLYLMGFIKIGFLAYEHKFKVGFKFRSRYLTAVLFGFAFAAGWTPCVGAVLGGILGLAASEPALAFSLLLAYAAGLGIPFLVVGAFVSQSSTWINRHLDAIAYITPVFGALLVAVGVLVFTQDLSLIADFGFVNNFLLSHSL